MLIGKAINVTMHVAVVTKFTARKALGHTVLIAIAILPEKHVLTCTKMKLRPGIQPVQTCIDAKIVGKMFIGQSKRTPTDAVKYTAIAVVNTLCLGISVSSNPLMRSKSRIQLLYSLILSAHRINKFPVSKVMPHILRQMHKL